MKNIYTQFVNDFNSYGFSSFKNSNYGKYIKVIKNDDNGIDLYYNDNKISTFYTTGYILHNGGFYKKIKNKKLFDKIQNFMMIKSIY